MATTDSHTEHLEAFTQYASYIDRNLTIGFSGRVSQHLMGGALCVAEAAFEERAPRHRPNRFASKAIFQSLSSLCRIAEICQSQEVGGKAAFVITKFCTDGESILVKSSFLSSKEQHDRLLEIINVLSAIRKVESMPKPTGGDNESSSVLQRELVALSNFTGHFPICAYEQREEGFFTHIIAGANVNRQPTKGQAPKPLRIDLY